MRKYNTTDEDGYMKIYLYEYLVTESGILKKDNSVITDFIEELNSNDELVLNENVYHLQEPFSKSDFVLFHYIESSELNNENIMREEEKKLLKLTKDELSNYRKIKNIFIAVSISSSKLYMTHGFESMDTVNNFLSLNSNTFKNKLSLAESIDVDKILDTVKKINSIEFKSVPQDVMFNQLENSVFLDLYNDQLVKNASLKISYEKNKKDVDKLIKKCFGGSVKRGNEMILNFKSVDGSTSIFNTRNLMKSFYAGEMKLNNDENIEQARETIYLKIKEKEEK